MNQNNKVKPTMENTNPFHWEMQLLAQEFNEREARQVASNDNHLIDQGTLREHNHNVAQLEDRKRIHMAILGAEQESEIDLINKKYMQKLQEVKDDYTKKRDALETELLQKSGKSYKKLQKLHTKNLSQSQEFERKAKDILQRMANSFKEENTICILESIREVSTNAAAAAETPPVSPASRSTTPVSQAETERIIQDQYIEASPSEVQPLLDNELSFELRDTCPYAMDQFQFGAPTPPTAHLAFRPSPENHPIKRQKTNELSYTSTKNSPAYSRNGASKVQDGLGIHIPIQSFCMASDKIFDSHAKSRFSSTKTSLQDHFKTPTIAQNHNVKQETENSSVVTTTFSNRASSIKTSDRKPTRAQVSAQDVKFDETSDILYSTRPANVEGKVFSNTLGRDLTRTQVTTQYLDLIQSIESVSTPAVKYHDHIPNGESETIPKNISMSPLLSPKVRPVHSQKSLDDDLMLNGYMDFPHAFAQIASQSDASLQTSRPLKSAPQKLCFEDGLTGDVSLEEKSHSCDLKGWKVTSSKRKASDMNMDIQLEDLTMPRIETSAQIKLERERSSKVEEPLRRTTNPSKPSNTELAQRVTDTPRPSNVESTRRLSNTYRLNVTDPIQQVANTPRPAKPAPRVTSTPRPNQTEPVRQRPNLLRSGNTEQARRASYTFRPSNFEPTRQILSAYKPSNAETQLSIVFFSIEFMSYDPGSPAKCYPVSWSGMNGSHNYRLQVMHKKNKILHPYDGTENKSSQYPKLIIDSSWVLGGFYDKQLNNHRLEIYRPRSKKEYKVEEGENVDPAEINSARMRIKFTDGVELERFLEWYRSMHPGVEIRPK
ncbi:hypothetical protein NHQ30_001958 [Ciborinia camelliae]|nr:hypothetical protein NHQ30_001958 [Ciborinia camelliae]